MDTQDETTQDLSPWVLGDRLRQHRTRAGLTQADVASRSEVKRHRYSDFERCHVRPTRDEIGRIAKALGVDLGYLLRGSDWRAPGPESRRPGCSFHEDCRWQPLQDVPTAYYVKEALNTWRDWTIRFLGEIRKRKDLPLVRRFLREVACESKLEALLILALLARGARPIWDSPLAVGFREWPIVLRGRQAGDCLHPGLELDFPGLKVVIFFQVSMQVRKGWIRVDGLVAVREFGARTRWVVGEVDGPDHVEEKDRERQVRHELPEVRLGYEKFGLHDPADLLLQGLLDRLNLTVSEERAKDLHERRSRKPRKEAEPPAAA